MAVPVIINENSYVRVTIAAGVPIAVQLLQHNQDNIQFQDEGSNLGASGTVKVLNFVGSSVSVARVGDTVTVTITGGGGSGDVTGPASSTDNGLVLFNGTTGKIIKDMGITLPSALQSVRRNAGNTAWEAFTPAAALGYTPVRVLYVNNSSSGLTGTTAETKVASVLIPGGTIGANDRIEISSICTKTGAAGSMTPRVYFNTLDAVGGVQVAVNSSTSANLWNGLIRRGSMKNSVSAQVWYNLSNAGDDMTSTNSAKLSTTINFAVDQYFVFSNQNGSAADTSTLESVVVLIGRQ